MTTPSWTPVPAPELRAIREEEPAVVNFTYLDEDVAERTGTVQFGQSRIGDSSISGTKVAD